ncbi:sacsin N-terminal ATP-binding-like domain-containing protein [Streptomyces sp. NPDC056105]|uniref:sacsin N-terminal ATP-binding-like domain-containing protein n=1 Tax=Streptomyces sp. NPDC056105 TaxID=3345714 RepID=UPI0035DF8B0E
MATVDVGQLGEARGLRGAEGSVGYGSEFAAQLMTYTREVLGEWQHTRRWNPGKQLRGLSRSTTRDYRGRFLLELLQNAHDAHPGDRNEGRVHVLLDEEEGEHGTLYVANAGNPFTWDGVDSVTKLSCSDKVVGEGIGNKGVGFRSVLQISAAPEIYSARPDGGTRAALDGYCFRFATPDDLSLLLADAELVRRATGEFPPLQLPFPVSVVPENCARLALAGHVTVIRLPLRSATARGEVRRRIDELAGSGAPVMLFLERLERLVLERRAGDVEERTELTRREGRLSAVPDVLAAGGAPAVSLAQVDLGPVGRFVLARGTVPAERLRATVAEAVDDEGLDDSWSEWSTPAVIEIALPVVPASPGRVYTFLPLGEDVTAPLAGHLNAPFYTKTDRTGYDSEHSLNTMLFDAAAETCLTAAAALRGSKAPDAARLAVDLVSWQPKWAGRVAAASRRTQGRELADTPIVPMFGLAGPARSSLAWGAPRAAVLWPEADLAVLTARAACEAGVAVVDTALPRGPRTRLAKLCEALRCPLEPSAEELADHVERIAATLPLPGLEQTVDVWDGVYADLPHLFESRGRVLQGRKLLLAADGTLQRMNGTAAVDHDSSNERRRSRRQAFFPPARGLSGPSGSTAAAADGDLAVPAALSKRLFYLHPGLTWIESEGQVRRQQARLFLEQHRLVRRFDAAGLLEHVRHALSQSKDQKLRIQALRFVFHLHRSRQSSGAMRLRDLGLYVPSADGPLIPATSGKFGPGWSGTMGEDLARVAQEGREESVSLRSLARQFVAPPDVLLRRGEAEADWRAFLGELGVTDGFRPVFTPNADTTAEGWRLTPADLARMAKVPVAVAEQWQPHIHRDGRTAQYPYTPYLGTPAWRLPGQETIGRLSEPARLAFARLLLHGLPQWPASRFTSTWVRDRSGNKDPQEVPTPLDAFVREQPWLPVRGRGRAVRFVRPREAWHCPPSMEEEPLFAPTIARQVSSLLESPEAVAKLRSYGLPTWNDGRDSGRLLAALADFVAEGAVGSEDRPTLQRANEYAWRSLVTRARTTTAPSSLPFAGGALLAESGELLIAVPFTGLCNGNTTLYVTDERAGVKARIAQKMERPLLVAPGLAPEIVDLLVRWGALSVRHVDEARLEVVVDEQPLDRSETGTPLVTVLPWLPLALASLADHTAQGIRPTEASLAELVAGIRRIGSRTYRTLEIWLDEEEVALPDRLGGVLPLPDDHCPLLMGRAQPEDWNAVARLAEPVAHLIGRPDLGVRLRLAARELEHLHADLREPGQAEFVQALGLSSHQLAETVQRLEGTTAAVVHRCYPFLVHFLGRERADALVEPPPRDIREFQAVLEVHAAELPVEAGALLTEARRSRDTDELREALGVGFAEFNATLAGLAPAHTVISHADAHREAIQKHLQLHRGALLDRLRQARLGRFDAREAQADWRQLRALEGIEPPAEWNTTLETATPEQVRARVEEVLAEQLGSRLPADGAGLPAYTTLLARNRAAIRTAVPDLVALVRACRCPMPTAMDHSDPAEAVTELLDEAGALDFRLLEPGDIVGWLSALGHWPAGMPASADPAVHGVTTAEVENGRRAADSAQAQRERRQRIVTVGGKEVDVHTGDFGELTGELQRALDADPQLLGSRNVFASMTPMDPGRRGAPPGGRGGAGSSETRRLSAAQREAIGYAGEWFAYQWLRRHYPAANETSWVSTNRKKFFPGLPGDDGLGYDFRVGSGRQPLLFEVKASQGEGGQIELGESEVRAAQRHTGSDRWRILMVTSVLDPARLRVAMLPNPFSARGRDLYREEGGALRFSYRL